MVKYITISVLLVCVIPVLLMIPFQPKDPALPDGIVNETTKFTDLLEPFQDENKEELTICILSDKGAFNLPIETYLVGVVLAEMPADFDLEALKAQAVVARTYTYRRLSSPKHSDGDICTDSACCQAYMDVDDYLQNGGAEDSVHKIETAVNETESEVLYYDGELIEATYFSCSGGRTEDAAEVWGGEVPYLQSVASPGEENASHYTDTVRFNKNEFCELLGIPESTALSVSEIVYTRGGGVSRLKVENETFAGTDFRSLLGLRSTAFVISIAGDTVTVTTKGFGHRVGMSQYGAEAMAVNGAVYTEILAHYYSGTTLGKY